MSRQYWNETINWIQASATAVGNTTSESLIVPALTIPGSTLSNGRIIRLILYGGYGTAATAPTLQLRCRLGGLTGTILAASGVVTLTASAGGGSSRTALWMAEFLIQTRTNGTTGTLMTNGTMQFFTTGTAAGSRYPIASGSTGGTTPVDVTADLTVDAALVVTGQWGTADANNSLQVHAYQVELLN